jgi:hypothetical protein
MSSTHLDSILRDPHGPLGPTMMHISHDSRDRLVYLRTVIHDPDDSEMADRKIYPLGQRTRLMHVASKGCITSPVNAPTDKGTKEWRSEVTQLTNTLNKQLSIQYQYCRSKAFLVLRFGQIAIGGHQVRLTELLYLVPTYSFNASTFIRLPSAMPVLDALLHSRVGVAAAGSSLGRIATLPAIGYALGHCAWRAPIFLTLRLGICGTKGSPG